MPLFSISENLIFYYLKILLNQFLIYLIIIGNFYFLFINILLIPLASSINYVGIIFLDFQSALEIY
jgi:hypothetical protein